MAFVGGSWTLLHCATLLAATPQSLAFDAFDVSVMLSDDVLYVSLLLASIGWGYVTTHPCWGTGLVIKNTFHYYVFTILESPKNQYLKNVSGGLHVFFKFFYVSEYVSFSVELKMIFLCFQRIML